MSPILAPANTAPVAPSALSELLSRSGVKSPAESLPLEILHNLRHQHDWTDLQLHAIPTPAPSLHLPPPSPAATPSLSTLSSGSSTPTGPGTLTIISGRPPRHAYIHPDLQAYLLKHSLPDSAVPVAHEFVIPTSSSERWTLARFCSVFDVLPERDIVVVTDSSEHAAGNGVEGRGNGTASAATGTRPFEWRDGKRVLLGMREARGEGTVVYYVMQEGEVKPRQNG